MVKTGPVRHRVRVRTRPQNRSEKRSEPNAEHWNPNRVTVLERCSRVRHATVQRVYMEHHASWELIEDCFSRALYKLCKTDQKYVDAIKDPRKYMYVGTIMELRSEMRTNRQRNPHFSLDAIRISDLTEDSELGKYEVVDTFTLNPQAVVESKLEFQKIVKAINKVKKDHKIGWRAVRDLSFTTKTYKQVAEEQGITVLALKNRIVRFRRDLFTQLPEDIRAQFTNKFKSL